MWEFKCQLAEYADRTGLAAASKGRDSASVECASNNDVAAELPQTEPDRIQDGSINRQTHLGGRLSAPVFDGVDCRFVQNRMPAARRHGGRANAAASGDGEP